MPYYFIKDPSATFDYTIDWSSIIESNDFITSSTWDIPDGLTLGTGAQAPSFNDTNTTFWISGGITGVKYTVTNHITLNSGIEDDEDIIFSIQDIDITNLLYKTRKSLNQYILSQLGYPIQNIEITKKQLDNAITSAIDLFGQYHMDAVEVNFIELEILSEYAREYQLNEKVSMVTNIYESGTDLNFFPVDVEPVAFVDNQFYPYIVNYDLVSLEVYKQRYSMLQSSNLNPVNYHFNSNTHKLIIYAPKKGKYFLEVEETLSTQNRILDDPWVRDYSVALAKKQWGTNLMKYEGANLPGGATFNYSTILSEASAEIDMLKQDLEEKYTMPLPPEIA